MAVFQQTNNGCREGTWLEGSASEAPAPAPFAVALRTVIVGVAARHRGHVLIELDPTWAPPLRVQPAVFAIVREAMENAYAHAGRAVTVIVRASGSLLSISDTGCGFDLVAIGPHEGHGLAKMRRLAHEKGLSLRLVSAAGVGTSIDVEIAPAG